MILVDAITTYETNLRHKNWCHMVSTFNRDELDEMALRIGLQHSWIQTGSFDHYDLTPPKRALAIKLGALEVSPRIILFGNYDYERRRPGKVVPEPYASEVAAIRAKCPRYLARISK